MGGDVFNENDSLDGVSDNSPEHAQPSNMAPTLTLFNMSGSDFLSNRDTGDDEGYETVAAQVIDKVKLKKRRATELLQSISSNLLELTKVLAELPNSPGTPSLDTLGDQFEQCSNQSQSTSNKGEGGEAEVLVVEADEKQNEKKRDNYQLVYKPRLSRTKANEQKWLRLQKTLKGGRYIGTERGNRLLGSAMSMVPKAGCAGFATALPIAVAGVLENAGVSVDENIVNCLLSKNIVSD